MGRRKKATLTCAAPALDPHQNTRDEPGAHFPSSLFKKEAHHLECLLPRYTILWSSLDAFLSLVLDVALKP